MVCYARPASLLAAIVAVAWLVFGGPVSHFFSTAAVMVAVLVATASAAAAAAVAFPTFTSTRRRRAGGGGSMRCRFQCQHAMTGQRLWLVTTADRRTRGAAGAAGGRAGQGNGVALGQVSRSVSRFGAGQQRRLGAERPVASRPGGEPGGPGDGLAGQGLAAVRELVRQGSRLVKALL